MPKPFYSNATGDILLTFSEMCRLMRASLWLGKLVLGLLDIYEIASAYTCYISILHCFWLHFLLYLDGSVYICQCRQIYMLDQDPVCLFHAAFLAVYRQMPWHLLQLHIITACLLGLWVQLFWVLNMRRNWQFLNNWHSLGFVTTNCLENDTIYECIVHLSVKIYLVSLCQLPQHSDTVLDFW
jgi:hypothetical protein